MFKQVLLFSLLCLVGLQACEVEQSEAPATDQNLVDLVYPHLDAANSRWFFFSSACRPFGMVTLNPDTQIGGAWGSGYRYHTDTIKGFSHIHAWTMAGLRMMPATTDLVLPTGRWM